MQEPAPPGRVDSTRVEARSMHSTGLPPPAPWCGAMWQKLRKPQRGAAAAGQGARRRAAQPRPTAHGIILRKEGSRRIFPTPCKVLEEYSPPHARFSKNIP